MTADLTQTVAAALRRLRDARGLTQAELAEAVGMAVEAYGRLERGASLPRAETLVLLSEALQSSTDELLGRVRVPPTPESDPPEVQALVHRVRQLDRRSTRALAELANELLRLSRRR